MSVPTGSAWRVFPWDPEAEEGCPSSASFIPTEQGPGRFDLPHNPAGVLYLSETPEHAVAEKIQFFRNQVLEPADLYAGGHRLALASVAWSDGVRSALVDLCDPAELVRLGIRPDETAAWSRATTQRTAHSIHATGHSGLRWWSAFGGEWHTIVLFRDRLDVPLRYGPPQRLRISDPAVAEAADRLGIDSVLPP